MASLADLVVLRHLLLAARRDKLNWRLCGAHAPQYAERLYVDPSQIADEIVEPLGRSLSGTVISGAWTHRTRPVLENAKIRYALRHWRDGLDWEAAGGVAHHMQVIAARGRIDHCRNLIDVHDRLAALDKVYETVRHEGRLRSMAEIRRHGFREQGGVYVHLGPDGALIFGGGGQHRLAMALALGLKRIPVQVGVVHVSAFEALSRFRVPSDPAPARL